MTRSNAALVEQATAASEAMSSQAQALGESMNFFDGHGVGGHNVKKVRSYRNKSALNDTHLGDRSLKSRAG